MVHVIPPQFQQVLGSYVALAAIQYHGDAFATRFCVASTRRKFGQQVAPGLFLYMSVVIVHLQSPMLLRPFLLV